MKDMGNYCVYLNIIYGEDTAWKIQLHRNKTQPEKGTNDTSVTPHRKTASITVGYKCLLNLSFGN